MTQPDKSTTRHRWQAVLRLDERVLGIAPLGTHKTAPRPKRIRFVPMIAGESFEVYQASLLQVTIERQQNGKGA